MVISTKERIFTLKKLSEQIPLEIVQQVVGECAYTAPPNFPENLLDIIYAGDCMEMIKQLPDESVDLVVSSPPYNIGKTSNDRKPLEQYLEWQTEVLRECHRVLKSTGSLFWQVGEIYIFKWSNRRLRFTY